MGPLTLIGGEDTVPYDRPNLSKDYLAGTASEEWIPLRPAAFYEEQGIRLVLSRRVVAVDVPRRRVLLDDATSHEFRRAAPRHRRGADPAADVRRQRQCGISHPRRQPRDHRRRHRCPPGGGPRRQLHRPRGGGLAPGPGTRGPRRRAGPSPAGASAGARAGRLHPRPARGAWGGLSPGADRDPDRRRLGDAGERPGHPGRPRDRGIGVRPSIELAAAAGLAVDGGIVVDQYLETSEPGIFAAGDVARYPDSRTGARFESSTGSPPSARGRRPRATSSGGASRLPPCRSSGASITT